MGSRRKITREHVLKLAAKLAAKHGESLTVATFLRETGMSYWSVNRLFARWSMVREAIGLSGDNEAARLKISKEKMLELAREQAAIHGEKLTAYKFQRAAGLSGSVIRDRFGSWGELRKTVGLSDRATTGQRLTRDEIIEDMLRVYRACRRRPRYHQYKLYWGKVGPQTIINRFGSWRHACEVLRQHAMDVWVQEKEAAAERARREPVLSPGERNPVVGGWFSLAEIFPWD